MLLSPAAVGRAEFDVSWLNFQSVAGTDISSHRCKYLDCYGGCYGRLEDSVQALLSTILWTGRFHSQISIPQAICLIFIGSGTPVDSPHTELDEQAMGQPWNQRRAGIFWDGS